MSQFVPVLLAKSKSNTNEGFRALLARDPRLGQVKVFDQEISTFVAISESGYIAIYQPGGKLIPPSGLALPFGKREIVPESITVLNVSDITGFDVLIENKSGLGGALLGAFLAGDGGMVVGQAISSKNPKAIDLLVKTKDFNNPQVIVPLFRRVNNAIELTPIDQYNPVLMKREQKFADEQGIVKMRTVRQAAAIPKVRAAEIQELLSLLDNVFLAHQNSQAPSAAAPQASSADELAKFKGLLDEGVISQEEFDAKKRQLLGL